MTPNARRQIKDDCERDEAQGHEAKEKVTASEANQDEQTMLKEADRCMETCLKVVETNIKPDAKPLLWVEICHFGHMQYFRGYERGYAMARAFRESLPERKSTHE